MSTTRKNRVPMSEQLKLINQCRQSGLTDADWCRENGIAPALSITGSADAVKLHPIRYRKLLMDIWKLRVQDRKSFLWRSFRNRRRNRSQQVLLHSMNRTLTIHIRSRSP